MLKIAYYISDYGHGHAARNLAIIRELLNQKSHDLHITICTSFTLDFIKKSLRNEHSAKISYRDVTNDFGFVLKENSLMPDIDEFNKVYEEYINGSENYINRETDFLVSEHINLVISDIPPFPFVAAKRANVPSIGISNFTWYSLYTEFMAKEKLNPLLNAYKQMDYFIRVATCREPRWAAIEEIDVAFYSRAINETKVQTLRDKLNPNGDKVLVYFGLGMKIEVDELQSYRLWDSDNCVFIVSSNTNVVGENIYKIPKDDTETQNYIAASDIVISKPGWSTLSEAISSHKPLLIINRNQMLEDQITIDYLHNHHWCTLIDWDYIKELNIDQPLISELTKQYTQTDLTSGTLDRIVAFILGTGTTYPQYVIHKLSPKE